LFRSREILQAACRRLIILIENRWEGDSMYRGFLVLLVLLMLVPAMPGCRGGDGAGGGQPAVEEMTKGANEAYGRALDEGQPKESAVIAAAEVFRNQEGVVSATVLGPDSLRIVFKDGSDLVVVLGKERM